MGLVNGFTDVLGHRNLALNGTFRVNQRELFHSWTPAKTGDFVADCWEVVSNNVDFIECFNPGYLGHFPQLELRGHGKRGQEFQLRNTSPYDLLYGFGVVEHPFYSYFTASVTAAIHGSFANSVPVEVLAQPPLSEAQYTTVYIKPVILKTPLKCEQSVNAVRSYNSSGLDPTQPGYIRLRLMADGEFYIILTNFAINSGLFRNPPQLNYTPISEDLARCKRYYQKGTGMYKLKATKHTTDFAVFRSTVQFPVEMAGTPSVSVNLMSIIAQHGDGNATERISQYNAGADRYLATGSIYPHFFTYNIHWSEATYAAYMYDNGMFYALDWFATV